MDIIISLCAIIILSPVYIVLYILVRSKLGSPVLFHQDRPGKNGKIFHMYKFRSMTDERDENGLLKPDEVRLTSFGRKLRATSLDELPELFCILKGDMSLVGPRPLLVQYLPLYSERQSHRHDVLPGLTGWAQVNGLRGNTSIRMRVEYDLFYIENWTMSFDIKIMFMTIFTGLINKNAY